MKQQLQLFGNYYRTLLHQHKHTYAKFDSKLSQYCSSPPTSNSTEEEFPMSGSDEERQQTYWLLFHVNYASLKIGKALGYFIQALSLSRNEVKVELSKYKNIETNNSKNIWKLYRSLRGSQIRIWEIYLILGQLLIVGCKIKKAIEVFEYVLELNESCGYAYLGLAISYVYKQQTEQSMRMIKKVEKSQVPKEISAYYYGVILFSIKRIDECIQKFNIAIESHQGLFPLELVYTRLSHAYYAINNADKALDCLEKQHQQEDSIRSSLKAEIYILIVIYLNLYQIVEQLLIQQIERDPQNFTWHYYRGDYDFDCQNYQGAINSYKKSLELAIPEFQIKKEVYKKKEAQDFITILYFNLSTSLNYCQRYEEAIHYAYKPLQYSNKKGVIYTKIASCYFMMKNHEQQSLECCYKAFENRLQEPQCCLQLCSIFYALKKYTESLALAKLLIGLDRKAVIIVYYLGMSYYRLNQVTNAIAEFKNCHEIQKHSKIYYGLGEIYIGLGEYEIALQYLNQSLSLIKEQYRHQQNQDFIQSYCQILTKLGQAYLKLGQTDKGKKLLQASIKKMITFNAVSLLGTILHIQSNYNAQIQLYNGYINSNATFYAGIYCHLGEAYSSSQQNREGMACFHHSINSGVLTSQASIGIAVIYFKQKEYEQSMRYYFKSLQVSINDPISYFGLAQIYLEKNIDEQLKMQITQFIQKLEKSNSQNEIIYVNLNLFYKLIGQITRSSQYFWKLFQPLKYEYESNLNSLTLQSKEKTQRKIANFKTFPQKSISSKNFLIDIEILLLYIITNNKRQCTKKMVYLFKKKQAKYIDLCSQIKLIGNQECRMVVCEYFLTQMQRINQKEGIKVYKLFIHYNFIGPIIGKKYIMNTLSQNVQSIQTICQFLFGLNISACDLDDIQVNNCQLLGNIIDSIKLHQALQKRLKLKTYSSSELISLLKIANQQKSQNIFSESILKRIKLQENQYLQVIPTKRLFVRIRYQNKFILKELRKIIAKFKSSEQEESEEQVELFFKEIKRVVEKFLTHKYLKNELIKHIYKQLHFLYIEYQESIEQKMVNFLEQFKENSNYSFDIIASSLKRILFGEEDCNQSQISLNSLSQREPWEEQEAQKEQEVLDEFEEPIYEQNSKMSNFVEENSALVHRSKQQQYFHTNQIIKLTYSYDQQKFKGKYYPKSMPSPSMGKTVSMKVNHLSYLFFKNTYDIMHQLSLRGETSPHVAKYWLFDAWSKQFAQLRSFEYTIQKRQAIHQQYSTLFKEESMRRCITQSNKVLDRIKINEGRELELEDVKIVDYLWRKGTKEILKYIICLVKGIDELKALKIFHLDLQFRNVIKVGKGDHTYKLMDFDLAFRLDGKSESCSNMRNIAKIIASCNPNSNDLEEKEFVHNAIIYVFQHISGSDEKTIYQKLGNCSNEEQRVNQFLRMFEDYANKYYFRQFKRMMKFLILEEILEQNIPNLYKTVKLWADKYCSSNGATSQKFINKMECFLK